MIPSAEFFVSYEHPIYAQQLGDRHVGLFSFIAEFIREYVGPLVPVVSWAGAQHLAERDGWLTSSTGRESDLPAPARLQSTADHIVSALAVLLREKGPHF